MARIFDVANSNNIGFWVIANDEQQAIDLAIEAGHVKVRARARVIDVTERMSADVHFTSLQELLDSGQVGQIGKIIKTHTFADMMENLQRGTKLAPAPGHWEFLRGRVDVR